jgi:hypothetical protein
VQGHSSINYHQERFTQAVFLAFIDRVEVYLAEGKLLDEIPPDFLRILKRFSNPADASEPVFIV